MSESNKKAEFGWVMFDWANSSYNLVISTAIFPTFFVAVTDPFINVAGFSLANSTLYAFTVSFAYLIICFISPILSGIADYGGSRKKYMRFFTTMGSLACMSLFFFNGRAGLLGMSASTSLWIGLSGFLIATLSHAGSLVFYDSYLADLVPPRRSDKLSARGYAFGYIGSVILLIFNICMIKFPHAFFMTEEQVSQNLPIRISLLSVGLWWLGFSQFSFAYLPKDKKGQILGNVLTHGIDELKKAWIRIRSNYDLKNYLFAFFCYSAGVQSVVYLAAPFAQKELKFESANLIMVILLLQIVAIVGAYLFAFVSRKTNNFFSMKIMLFIWVVICICAYYVQTHFQFYFLAAAVGMVIGGIQALSRSTFAKLIPKDRNDITCFFSFYDVVYYLSVIGGTFLFGLIEQITGSMRYSVISVIIFFVFGFLFLQKVKIKNLEG
ncbi:MAG: MFS transporter [Saprospiraceae bacterium]|nr:MFS transporter [Saprospiraceae bacterium]